MEFLVGYTYSKCLDINPAHFTIEPLGQVGNANRRFFHGPGLNNWDIALLKNINLTESKMLQLRFELFKTWIYAQFINPTGSINADLPHIVNGVNQDGLFGMVNSARDARIFQIGVKFLF